MCKRILKIFIASLTVLFIIVFSSFSAFASLVDNVFYMPLSNPPAGDRNAYVEVITEENGILSGYVYVIVLTYDVVGEHPEYDNVVSLDVTSNTLKFTRNLTDSAMSIYCVKDSGYTFDLGTVIFPDMSITDSFSSSTIVGVRYYGCIFSHTAQNFNTVPFSFAYGSDSASLSVLTSILSILQSKNNNDIIQNQDENTDKIIQNQEDNQSEITEGWQQDESIDTTTTDDYADKDKELQARTEQGRSETISVLNNFGSLFTNDGHLYKGLMAVSAVFSEFFKLDWIASLINFSLALGVFAFVIGTGSEVFKSAHERHEDSKINKIDSYDERWLM